MSKAEREKRLDELNQKLGITHPDKLTEYDHQEMEEREWLKRSWVTSNTELDQCHRSRG